MTEPAASITAPSAEPDGGPVILHGVSWEQYDALVRALGDDHPSLRLTYREGTLEIMTTSPFHELVKKVIARLLETWALERDVPIVGYGAATFRKEERERGLEPDECYCLGPLHDVPELAIEVVHRHRIDKLDVYAGLGVPEVWRWEDGRISIHRLDAGRYRRVESSGVLPSLDVAQLGVFVARAVSEPAQRQTAIVREYRDTIRRA